MNEAGKGGVSVAVTGSPKVVLADDEVHIRYLIRNVLRTAGCEVVGEANNGEDALALYRRLRPDLLVVDINLPLLTGDAVLAEVMREFPDAKVIVLTMVADVNTVKRCLELGAANYILKSTKIEDIRQQIRDTLAN